MIKQARDCRQRDSGEKNNPSYSEGEWIVLSEYICASSADEKYNDFDCFTSNQFGANAQIQDEGITPKWDAFSSLFSRHT